MANAFDYAAAAQTGANPSWSHTCTGDNRVLIVTGKAAGADASGITYNGVALTKAVTVTDTNSSRVQIWYLLNPATGAHTVAVSGMTDGRMQSVSYTGVKQTGFPDASATVANSSRSGAGNITVALTVVASDCWVVATNEDSTLNPTAGVIATTRRGGATFWGSGNADDSNGTVATGSINVGYTYAGTNASTIAALSFAPATATSNASFLMFMI